MDWQRLDQHLVWNGEISSRPEKEAVAEKVAARVEEGQVVGVGSGSSSFLALLAIGERARREGLRIETIPTSLEVGLVCAALGLPTTTLRARRPDWGFDGADEVDPQSHLLKGRGGAMFQEKLVMASSAKTYILVDSSKFVSRLGETFAVPVEAHAMALSLVEERLYALGASEVRLRPAGGKDGPVVSENGNPIFDARFEQLPTDPEAKIKAIPGVIESGLFCGYSVEILTP